MKKLQFKTNSRHISQLGRELVTDFVTALVELIKNSYDADAYGVKIILDKPNTPQSRNGNKEISTNYKKNYAY